KTPDQGLTAPLLMFVAVRAIAPVAGIPPNKGVMILAKPCPNNSLFDRCCFPVMPSATTAESKDSIPPSMAITKAGCQRYSSLSNVNSGKLKIGKAYDIPLKAVQIVATFHGYINRLAIVGIINATSNTGTLGKILGTIITEAKPINATIMLNRLTVSMLLIISIIF